MLKHLMNGSALASFATFAAEGGGTTFADITAVKGHTQAVAFARKGGDALSKVFHNIADAKFTERSGPIVMMVTLESLFSEDEIAAIPVVGSKQGETGNKPYDKYTATIKTQDGERKVPGSWYTDVVKASSEGEAIVERIKLIDGALASPAGNAEAPPDVQAMGTVQKRIEKKRLQARLADIRTALTKGAMLWHQCVKVNEMNPERVVVKLPIGADGSVIGNTIRLKDPTDAIEDEIMNVGGFLQLDPDKAAKDPDKGTITSLKATAARAPRNTGKKTGSNITIPSTLEEVKNLFNALASALDNGTDQGKKLESQLLAACAKEGQEGNETVIAVGNVCMAADNIWNIIGNRYNTLMAQKAAAMNTKANKAA